MDAQGRLDQLVSANLYALRQSAGMTQTELAEACEARGLPWHQQTVQKLEKGVRPLKLTEALAVADALGVAPDLLWADTETVGWVALTEAALARVTEHERQLRRSADDLGAAVFQLQRTVVDSQGNLPAAIADRARAAIASAESQLVAAVRPSRPPVAGPTVETIRLPHDDLIPYPDAPVKYIDGLIQDDPDDPVETRQPAATERGGPRG